MILQSLSGLPAFLAYLLLAAGLVAAYLFAYTSITPHDEFALIRNNVPGAAMALGASTFGFALPLASAISHSANVIDCLIWGVIALIVQIAVYYLVRLTVPNLSKRIEEGELGAPIWLGFASVAAGMLSAASMAL
jgi:putative membrane protein